jgi:hypothetical protein
MITGSFSLNFLNSFGGIIVCGHFEVDRTSVRSMIGSKEMIGT